ncbi:MAG: 1-deoxy-D-xylulose-5-phosphate reductoisomerase [Actinomycetota bacterium]
MTTTVAVAGSTGSIGTQTLEVVASRPDWYRIVALATGSRVDELVAQAEAHRPEVVALADESRLDELRSRLPAGIDVLVGPDAMGDIATTADVTVNGVVGFAGLPVTLSCLRAGRRLALANKESLIAAGPVVQGARTTPGAELVPVDSEHAAIHQCLRAAGTDRVVERIQLTASGGPFRGRSASALAEVSIDEALAHPTWSMGPKITVDSSTLMNKGLEVIEANELFGSPAGAAGHDLAIDDIEVVVHPQSIVHSMVTYADGSTMAQLSEPDMRLPIAYALAFPERFDVAYGRIDWTTLGRLDFEPPDRVAFPCLDLAFEAGRVGGTAPAWLSAANEVAVAAFLDGRIRWVDIAPVIATTMDAADGAAADSLDAVLAGDAEARRYAGSVLDRSTTGPVGR